MKGGLAAYLVAAAVVLEVLDDRRGDLVVSSVIEEECGGNGMWSVLRAGHGADGTLIGEPTGLLLAHAGTGVVWARLSARGAVRAMRRSPAATGRSTSCARPSPPCGGSRPRRTSPRAIRCSPPRRSGRTG